MKLLLAALLITGCTIEVYPKNIANLAEACNVHGGWAVLYAMEPPDNGRREGRCVDGTYVDYKEVEK